MWTLWLAAEAAPLTCLAPVGRLWVETVTGEQARADEALRAAMVAQEPGATAPGGYVVVHLRRRARGLGTVDGYLLLVESRDVERVRREPTPETTAPTPYGSPLYTIVAPLPERIEWPLTVWAIDQRRAHRCGFLVEQDGRQWLVSMRAWRARVR